MASPEVAFLGPLGTYSHLVAEKRFGKKSTLIPLPSILDVCSYVSRHGDRYGVVPIENSSGGAIYETVDILLTHRPRVHVMEELTLNVRLALIGRKNTRLNVLYSHFAPMEHCAPWIRKNLPRVRRQITTSTASAAIHAASEPGAAALGNRKLARVYNLDVLQYPVEADIPNITSFLVIKGKRAATEQPNKTTLAAKLPNVPGSLCDFLDTFRNASVNLSRIISRPIRGSHKEYAFLVDIEGGTDSDKVKRALKAARKTCVELRIVGSYPSRRRYSS